MKRLLLFLITVAVFGIPVSAADIFFAATSAGSNNGTTCSNAFAYTDVTHGINAAQTASWVAGNTLHLCGTITGALGGVAVNVNGSGTSVSPITIKFETGANLTSPAWGAASSGAIVNNGFSWIVIDGGTNGIIQNTANGTGLANGIASGGVAILSASNNIVKNLTIANMCQHTLFTDTIGCTSGGIGDVAILVNGTSSNVTITNNIIHDATSGIFYSWSNGSNNITVSSNTITRTNWGIGSGGAGTASNFLVTLNDISCVVAAPCNWNDVDDNFHHNGIIVFPQAADFINNLVISNNFFHDINTCTGGIFIDPANPGDAPTTQIYNNIFYTTPGQVGPSNAWITLGQGGGDPVTNVLIVNNTIIGPSSGGIISSKGPFIKNNIIVNTGYGQILFPGFTGMVSDFNDYFGLTGQMAAEPGFYNTVPDWTAATGLDVHSIVADPNLTTTFLLNSGSPAIGSATNLTSLGIAGLDVGAPQLFGANGSCGSGCFARPASGAWDMGAKPFNAAAPSAVVSLSPSSIAFSNQIVNTTSGGQVITLTNTGSATLNISSITLTGTNSSLFGKSTTCVSTLAASSNCTVTITFTPTSVGSKTASVTFTTDATTSPDNVGLTGTGVTQTITKPTGIMPATLLSGTVGQPYPAVVFTVTGGLAPYTFTVSGAPPGVPLLQIGNPTTPGIYSPKVTATDSEIPSVSVAQTYSLVISSPTPPVNTYLFNSSVPSLSFTAVQGTNPVCQTFTLADNTPSGEHIPFSVTSSSSWLSAGFTPKIGTTAQAISVCPTASITGSLSGTIVVTAIGPSTGGFTISTPLTIPVTFIVSAPPQIQSYSFNPQQGTISLGQNVTVSFNLLGPIAKKCTATLLVKQNGTVSLSNVTCK